MEDEIKNIHGQNVTLDAKPQQIHIDPARTAILVVDMQNDFGSEGGLFHRAGIDISSIRRAVGPTAKVLDAARETAIKIVFLKMGFQPDLCDLGSLDSPNRVRHLLFGVGKVAHAPTGEESRILVRDTWNTDILPELAPKTGDIVLYKHRFSGFYETELDTILKRLGVLVCPERSISDTLYPEPAPCNR